jgi:hypothetical protein
MALPLQAIRAAGEGVFQRRLVGKDPIKHVIRVAELKRSLETTGEPFRVPVEVPMVLEVTQHRGPSRLPRMVAEMGPEVISQCPADPDKAGFLTLLRRDQKPPA